MILNTLRKIFKNQLLTNILVIGIGGITLLTMFPPDYFPLKKIANYAFYILFLDLFLIFIFLALDNKRLMFTSILCTGILSLYLKQASNTNIVLPVKNDEIKVKMGLFSVNSFQDNFYLDLENILSQDADLLIFNEITPDWADALKDFLDTCYSHSHIVNRLDLLGQAFFSKLPLENLDTLIILDPIFKTELYTIGTELHLDENFKVKCISTYSLPPINQESYSGLDAQFDTIMNYFFEHTYPSVVLADLYVPNWLPELQSFKQKYEWNDSRRTSKIFKMPFDHLFYSGELECIEFLELQNENNYFGIIGTYQKKINHAETE